MSKLGVGTGPMANLILCWISDGSSCGFTMSQHFMLMTDALLIGFIKKRSRCHTQKVRVLQKWLWISILLILDGYNQLMEKKKQESYLRHIRIGRCISWQM